MKKFAIIALSFVLVLGLMTACGGNNSATETQPSSTTTTPSTTKPTTAPTTAPTVPSTSNDDMLEDGKIDGKGDAGKKNTNRVS